MKNILILLLIINAFSTDVFGQNIEKINLSNAIVKQSTTEGNLKPSMCIDNNYLIGSSSMTQPALNSSWEADLNCKFRINKIKIFTELINSDLYIVFSNDPINTYMYPSDGNYPPSIFDQNIDLTKSLVNQDNYYIYINSDNLGDKFIETKTIYAQYVSIFTTSNISLKLTEIEIWGGDDCEPSILGPNVFNDVLTETCDDGIDNDDNGLVDCEDWQCSVRNTIISHSEPTCPICNDGEICIDANNVSEISFDGGVTWVNFDDRKRVCYDLGSGLYNLQLRSPGGCIVDRVIDMIVPRGTSSSSCNNGDFEIGDFTDYEFGVGLRGANPNGPHNITSTAFDPRVHQIVSSNNFVDPIVGNLISNTGTLGSYFAKIGDTDVISMTQGISELVSLRYCLTVEEAELTFQYAQVMQDPQDNHTEDELPFLSIEVIDDQDNILFTQLISSDDEFLFDSGEIYNGTRVRYRPWDCGTIDLSDYIGQDVCINFNNGDCGRWEHWGYTYIDNICSLSSDLSPTAESEICATTFCQGQAFSITSTPGSYNQYNWEISLIDANDNIYNTWISNIEIGFLASIDDVKSYYETNSGYTINCRDRVSITLNVYNSCSSNSSNVEVRYNCADYEINYCSPLSVCSGNSLIPIQGNSNCNLCTFDWEPKNRLINSNTDSPSINADFFDIYTKTYTYVASSPEGCVYKGEVTLKSNGFDLEASSEVGSCSYTNSLNIILSENLQDLSNLDIDVTITNIRNGESYIINPTGTGLIREISETYLRTSTTEYRFDVEIFPAECVDGVSCKKSYLFDVVGRTTEKGNWKASWPTVFSPNGDGVNDTYSISFATHPEDFPVDTCGGYSTDYSSIYYYKLAIYDGWGNNAFRGAIEVTKDPMLDLQGINGSEIKWDGTFDGQPVADGVYISKIYVDHCYTDDFKCTDCGENEPFQYCFKVKNNAVHWWDNSGNVFTPTSGITVLR